MKVPSPRFGEMVAAEHIVSVDGKFYRLCLVPPHLRLMINTC